MIIQKKAPQAAYKNSAQQISFRYFEVFSHHGLPEHLFHTK